MIQARSIHKYFGDLHVLKGVDISVDAGELVSIVGASGAGKTTLLQILGTLDTASPQQDTEIIIDQTDILALSDNALAAFRNQNLGFIFQFHQLLPEFTALENVCLPAFIANVPKKEAEGRATELLDFLGLQDRIHHKPNALSGGEQQMLATARALMAHPRLLLLDEPSMGLAPVLVESTFETIQAINDEGTTILLVEQNATMALSVADRGYVLQTGEIVLSDTAENLKQNAMVQKAYLGIE